MTYLILLLSLLLRLISINQSLWLDESIEALALMGRMGPILRYALYDFQPPIYHLIGVAWTHFAGYSELSLRVVSLMSGLGLVYFLSLFGRKIGGVKLGTIVGLLAATNPLLIYYSQEGRTYEMTALFVTASFYYFYLLIDKNRSKSSTFYFILFTTLALWSSYIAWFVVALQLLYLLYKKAYKLLVPILISLSTLIIWLPSLMTSLGIGISTATHTPEWGKVVGGLSLKSVVLTWVKAVIGRISFDSKIIYGMVVIVLATLHGLVLKNLRRPNSLIWLWLSTILIVILISFFVPVYSYFRLLFVLPAYLLLLGLGLVRSRPIFTYLILGSQLAFSLIYFVTPNFHRENWRQVVADYGSDATYALPSINQNAPLLYYKVDPNHIIEPKQNQHFSSQKIIYIKYVEDVFDPSLVGTANLKNANYHLTAQKVYPGLQVDIYEKNNY